MTPGDRKIPVSKYNRRLIKCLQSSSSKPLAGHADPRTTRLYDRRDRKITRDIVEQISI